MEAPNSIEALIEQVQTRPKVGVLGNGTKSRLSSFASEFYPLSTRNLSGVIEYEASEYTITALAGTPLKSINQRLQEKGQYLPFSPLLIDAGATLGGTVASGLAGAGRFHFGAVRDFIIGARFIDGNGKLISVGGKVVKNAAGFDVSKFLVGSLGRMGVITELTFKVFPRAKAAASFQLPCDSHQQAMEHLMRAAGLSWELDALDYAPNERALYFRLRGPEEALEPMEQKMRAVFPQLKRLPLEEAEALWSSLREFKWANENCILAKVPTSPKSLARLLSQCESLPGLTLRATAGAACAWVAAEDEDTLQAFHAFLTELEMSGMVFRGSTPMLWLGQRRPQSIEAAVKKAMDPPSRFPEL